ncbi:MAG: substrate-binding domain-containing protein [Victivallales bacterium]|nr:substrate-binding domain-containing protein [Victivallales bacterium]
MKKSNILVVVILALSAVLFVSGVVKKIRHSRVKQQQRKMLAVIPKGTANMWWDTVRLGAQAAAEKGNADMVWTGPEMETDREKQIQAVDDMLVKNVDAVVLGPNDFNALARSVDKIKEKGIPCIIIDSPVNSEKYDAFAGTDNYRGGADAARRLGAVLNGRGTIILTHFVQNSASTEERARGFKETLKAEFPEMKLVAEQYTLGTVEDARQKTTDMLTKIGNVDGMFAVNHPASVGAYKALQTSGRCGKIKYVGFDSDPVLLEGIERGEVEALIVQNPYEIGYRGVELALQMLNGGKLERNNNVPSMIVDAKNLDEMKKRFPSALGL